MAKTVNDMDARQLNQVSNDADDTFTDAGASAVRPIEYLFGSADVAPAPTVAVERDIRYERGSTVYAIDGPVGTLQQMVIDEDVAEVKALVIRMAAKNESVLMPPELVDKCVGKTLLLNVTKEQFAKGASRSPRFDHKMFTAADAKMVAAVIPLAFRGNKQRSVVSISRDAMQTSEVLEPSPLPQAAPAGRFSWKRFNRLSWRRARPELNLGTP